MTVKTIQTKLSEKLVLRLSYLGSGLSVFLGNAGGVLAEGKEGWGDPSKLPTPPMMDPVEMAMVSLKYFIITPIFLIGIAVYLLLFLYKISKRDSKDLKNLRKVGKISLFLGIVSVLGYLVGPVIFKSGRQSVIVSYNSLLFDLGDYLDNLRPDICLFMGVCLEIDSGGEVFFEKVMFSAYGFGGVFKK